MRGFGRYLRSGIFHSAASQGRICNVFRAIQFAKKRTITAGEPHDPRLPTKSADIAILVHMYHEIAEPYALLYNLVPALKSGARVGIVDTFKPTPEHGTPLSLLRCELAAVGYREIRLDRLTGSDAYLGIFAPPSVATRTPPEAMVACERDGDLGIRARQPSWASIK
jgi:hypothetical protein